MIDYTAAATSYDNTRRPSDAIIDLFDATVHFAPVMAVLDFGCGTGNYLARIRERYGCACYGVEPSEAMRARARTKSLDVVLVDGDHCHIPFDDGQFDFAYMTDVIHHVQDIRVLFSELGRVLKPDGRVCVVTESHAQIERRFYNRYFPSLVANEKRRYPDCEAIVASASAAGLASLGVALGPSTTSTTIDTSFVRNVEEKNYSMFRLLSDDEFAAGLSAIKHDFGRAFQPSGQSLLWFVPA